MWIWFADSISALVGFLRALLFPPTPKNRNPFMFLVNSSGLSLYVQSLLGCLGFFLFSSFLFFSFFFLPLCALRLSHSGAFRTRWVRSRALQKKMANYYLLLLLLCLSCAKEPAQKPRTAWNNISRRHFFNIKLTSCCESCWCCFSEGLKAVFLPIPLICPHVSHPVKQ